MEILHFFLFIIQLVVAGVAVFFIAHNWVSSYLNTYANARTLELRKAAQENTLPLRLQAYERMVLLLERINPSQAILRVHQSGMTVKELHGLLIADINNEFNHNITQQIYIGDQAWIAIRRLKDDTISLVNNLSRTLPSEAPSLELAKAILAHVNNVEENPYETAIKILKNEIQSIF